MEKQPTEDQIKELGFNLIKQYNHDQFNTNRYEKGALQVEFTYESEELVTVDLTVYECNCTTVTFEELQALTPILGRDNV